MPEEDTKDSKGQDSGFLSEATDQMGPFGGPENSNTFHKSSALLAPNVTPVSSVSFSSSEDEEECICSSISMSLLIPHPLILILFHLAQIVLNI